jgi:hypothetical protein
MIFANIIIVVRNTPFFYVVEYLVESYYVTTGRKNEWIMFHQCVQFPTIVLSR